MFTDFACILTTRVKDRLQHKSFILITGNMKNSTTYHPTFINFCGRVEPI